MFVPEKLHVSFRQQNTDFDIHLDKNGQSDYKVQINGISYAVLGDKEKLPLACSILRSVPLGAIANSDDLKERLSLREDISFPIKKNGCYWDQSFK